MTPTFEKVTTPVQLEQWVERLRVSPLFALDTETTGFNIRGTERDPRQDKIVGISLATRTPEPAACYIPIRHNTSDSQLSPDEVVAALKPVLEDPAHAKILLNAPFDLGHFRNEGIIVRNVHDVQLMSFVVKGGTSGHNMDDLCWEKLDNYDTVKFTDVCVPEAGHKTFADVRLDHATIYAAEDTWVTLELFDTLRSELKASGLWTVYNNVDRTMPEVVANMQYTGVLVDKTTLKELETQFQERILELEAQIYGLVGPVNLGSSKELRDLLYGKLNLAPLRFTPGGEPSADAKALEALSGEHDVIDLILEWRTYMKLLSTYVVPLPREIAPETGRVHPQTNLTFTRTARLSMSDPSLHQIPSKEKIPGLKAGLLLRRAFVARPGYKLIAADYSQIEVRVLAHITGEPTMIRAFKNGHDFHAANAAQIFGGTVEQYMDKHDEARQEARRAIKAVTFGLLYGAGPRKIASEAKISEEEAKRFIGAFFEGNPRVDEWVRQQHQLVHQERAVYTLLGRRLPVDGAGSSDKWLRFAAERRAVNYVIQGSAAELNRLAMQQLHAEIEYERMMRWADAHLLLSVHDELVVECDEANAERMAPIVQDIMEHAADDYIAWEVPIIAEPGIGANWYEAKNA